MTDSPFSSSKVITQETLVAILDRCDAARDFVVQVWLQNPQLAKQGGSKVAALLGKPHATTIRVP